VVHIKAVASTAMPANTAIAFLFLVKWVIAGCGVDLLLK
jgi:hypothetical protein